MVRSWSLVVVLALLAGLAAGLVQAQPARAVTSATAVTLTADKTSVSNISGGGATLTAKANGSLDGYVLSIYNQTSHARICTTASNTVIACAVGWTPATQDFVAVVGSGETTYPPATTALISSVVSISPAPFSVTLTAAKTTLGPGQSTTAQARANQMVDQVGYLSIYDQTSGARICYEQVWDVKTCNLGWNENPHTFVAYVSTGTSTTSPPPGVKAISNEVIISSVAFTVNLTSTQTSLTVGQSATLTASSNWSVDGWNLSIYDQTTGARKCTTATIGNAQCAVGWYASPHSYIATLSSSSSTTYPPAGIKASSNPVTISPLAFAVTLSAPKTALAIGESTTLTATANQSLSGTGYALNVYDQTAGTKLTCSGTTTVSCGVGWGAQPHTYLGYIASGTGTTNPPSGVQATSNAVTVAPTPLTVTLVSDRASLNVGDHATLTATASQGLTGSPYSLRIFDQTTGQALCTASTGVSATCAVGWTSSPHTYIAHVYSGTATQDPPAAIVASANTVAIAPAPFSVSLTTDKTEVPTDGWATLTATANQVTTDTPFALRIIDETANTTVATCTGSTCTGSAGNPLGGPHTYAAYIANNNASVPPGGVQAVSAHVFLHAAPWAVTLTAEGDNLVAAANQILDDVPYAIQIIDNTAHAVTASCSSGMACGGPFTAGHEYTAYVATPNSGVPPSGVQAFSGAPETVGHLQLASVSLALAAFPLAVICDSVAVSPVRTNAALSTESDQTLACQAAIVAGTATLVFLQSLIDLSGPEVAEGMINFLLHDLGAVNSPQPNPDTLTLPRPRIPLDLPDFWPVQQLADDLRTRNQGLTDDQSNVLARACLVEVAAAGGTYSECTDLPIFFSGQADVPEATQHVAEALDSNPLWVQLNYEKGVTKAQYVSRDWYRGADVCDEKTSSQSCDEYPFFATEQGGPNAHPDPSLKAIDKAQNSLQGSLYGGFIRACDLSTGTLAADPTKANSTGGSSFLSIPVPDEPGAKTIPTLRVCGGEAAPVVPADPETEDW